MNKAHAYSLTSSASGVSLITVANVNPSFSSKRIELSFDGLTMASNRGTASVSRA